MWGITRYQWTVLLAAWLGWGFDAMDALLFNFVAPNCIPTLMHLPIGSPAARSAALYWTGLFTSLLLLGWAAGGLLFGFLCDRFGRLRMLMLTMLMYAAGTAACAAATSLWMLLIFRIVASLGIGGEWAAGASMVAEVMPEKRRIEAGALLYTAAPLGIFLATFINYEIAGVWFADDPTHSWRYVFAFGLLPALAAIVVRFFVHEPERWSRVKDVAAAASVRQLFAPAMWRRTVWGTFVAIIALFGWWCCNAFIPIVASGMAREVAAARGYSEFATQRLAEHWIFWGGSTFNLGGLIGTLLTVPLAKRIGRRPMFAIYFAASGAVILGVFGWPLSPELRLDSLFLIGITVFGVFGAFTYYLPELFPTRLRATGSGFSYNIGRVAASVGPFIVGAAAVSGGAVRAIFYVGFIPLAGALFAPFYIETRNQVLPD